ncbi:hypothetical protein C5167_044101 [Papaver somniferum]|uniref:Uncharacterized protein n=1 Tax=Papaver somniferum TaxID=3469 RepID=A0A4Y7L8J6_PAPSO|nr:hypothetical protein C5167_044101 [Papaver somniferum]
MDLLSITSPAISKISDEGILNSYLFDAIEIDVTLADSYGNMVIGGIMEHIGVYFGDSRQLKYL